MLEELLKNAKAAKSSVAALTRAQKDAALLAMADALEARQDAILDANRNAIKNEAVNAVFTCGKAEEVLPPMVEKGTRAHVAVLDPPRNGCDPATLKAVADARVERIVYVSCNPATLARDIKILTGKGFRFIKAAPVDMFPRSTHVECVVLMSKAST